ncbi:MAG TPA: PA domain-containing protein [Pyrinomonadaceae bacterium]|nr:PA domain-containing protein [Pyrinomonadaceae bacterium]
MKNKTSLMKLFVTFVALVFIGLSAGNTFAGEAQFVIVNINAAGVGFNDPTPAAPVGGNTGTTLGEQRLIAFQHAAAIWSARLDSNVPIRIRAQFTPLGAGVLGSAGPRDVFRDFPNAPLAGTWYHVALANKLAGVDLNPTNDDINANFSTNFNFYLGLDNNHGALNDLVAVLLHEFAHGLGFSQNASLTTGALLSGFPDAYNTRLFDLTQGLTWPQMTNAQRVTSATNFGRVVWTGAFVTAGVPNVLSFGSPEVRVLNPVAIAGIYQFGTAGFGPAIGNPNVQADVVAAVDAVEAGGTSTDGCSAFSNAAAVAGKIALIERGLCGFAVKARNATDAGAAAVIIYNQAANVNAAPPGMADDGINGQFVTIPTVSVRRADGLAIAGGGTVTARIGVDPSIRAGADALGRARVYAPFPVVGGSSISHYDTVARRNLLMEPAINADLTHKVKAPDDLTFELLRDVGWTFPDADNDGVPNDEDCNPNSNLSPTIIIGGIDTGVPNTLFANGCTMADILAQLAADHTNNHGDYVSAVAALTNQWVADGLITGRQKGAIQSAAAQLP